MIKDNTLRFRAGAASFFNDVILPDLFPIAHRLGLRPETVLGKSLEDITAFFQTMPTAYCLFTLSQCRDQNMQRPIKKTDMYDIWALSIAIPYCDIVLADSMFASIAKQAKLDKIYNTVILNSPEELLKHL